MRVVVLGADGLLGRSVAADLAGRGHEVIGVRPHGGLSDSLAAMPTPTAYGRTGSDLPPAPPVPVAGLTRSIAMDVVDATETDLDAIVHGADAVVHALAVDDAPSPAAATGPRYQRLLVGPTVRITRAAIRQGVGHVVVLGSAYATFDRMHPQWHLAQRHPYIQGRVDQARRAIDAATGSLTAVSVIETPSVFGVVAGGMPAWRAAFIETLRRGPVALALPGGAAAVSHEDVAYAVAGLLDEDIPPGRHPIATDNITHRRLADIVLAEIGRHPRMVTLHGAALGIGLRGEARRLLQRSASFGLDPARVGHDLLTRTLFLDTETYGAALGLTPRPLDDAVRETVRAAYPDLVDH
jgi:nucleoside-diphosphate-sugar epimerase